MGDVKASIKVNRPKSSTYRVSGKTLKEVMKALDSRDEWGTYDSTQNQKSAMKVDKDGKVGSVTVELNPDIEMPVWSDYGNATKEQKAAWDKMWSALKTHEDGHHDIQLKCAAELEKAIKSAKSLDKDTLGDMIEKSQTECQKKQDAYDSRTSHGAKDGVELDLTADP